MNTALTTADLTGVMEIGEGAFENAALEAVRLNANASVGERAFANTKLTQLVIPASGSFPLSAVEKYECGASPFRRRDRRAACRMERKRLPARGMTPCCARAK